MLEVEVVGAERAPGAPPREEIERLVALALASAGIRAGHIAVQFVSAGEISALNRQFRGKKKATDVLSFPIDGWAAGVDGHTGQDGPLELGDVVICPEHTADLREAIVHGALHLVGMDHERDQGEMLTVQRELLHWNAQVAR